MGDVPGDFDRITSDLDVDDVEQAENWNRGTRRIPEIRREHLGDPWTAREECPDCRTTEAYITQVSSNRVVRCERCDGFLYNAPKEEIGDGTRPVTTRRRGIKPGQQARIMDRDGGQCILCAGRDELEIGHLISVQEGRALGMTDQELDDDANLAAMCKACNLGLGSRSISPQTYACHVYRLMQAEKARTPAAAPSTVDLAQ